MRAHLRVPGLPAGAPGVGPRGGVTTRQEIWRRSGQTKVWKTRPENFSVPIKHGMYVHSYATQANAAIFHTPDTCPLTHRPQDND